MHFQIGLVTTLLLVVSHVTAELLVDKLFPHHRQDPDRQRTFEELITSHGFQLQAYTVRTEDGYHLTLHRVVTSDYSTDYSIDRKPVIVQHGLLGSSNNFFFNSPYLKRSDNTSACGDNFGFCLVLTGRYDIWLPNSRGNGFSDGHDLGLTTSDHKYWDFTFEELALYDTTAAIDFVKQATGYEKVGYVGYSQGANIMFALLSLKPEYADSIQPYIAWAPPPFISNMTSTLRHLLPLEPALQRAGGKYVLSNEMLGKITEDACGFAAGLCVHFLNQVMGKSTSINETRLPVYFHYFPSPVSNHQMVHFAQLYQTGKFIRYDHGSEAKNMEVYGQPEPPVYPLENIPDGFTIAILRGNTDGYVSKEDADRLIEVLREANVNVDDYVVPAKVWSHLDFVIGMNSGPLVNDKTIELLDKYME